ncbi:MAG TPA: hypothetical protein VKX28_26695 [Xanthobacteraceae bacterium]|nr:hypothetical protein [Xanthobacteraceae bacterium]
MSRPKINAITERTAREWPADHPLREVSVPLTPALFARAEFLICSNADEDRLPPAADDYDVPCECTRCGAALLRRASAPKLKPICMTCWGRL